MALEHDLKSLAIEEGCIRAGIARKEAFSEAPASADMRYLKPWANAVVAFVVIPEKAGIQSFQNVLDSGFRRSDELCDFLRNYLICIQIN